MHEKQLDWFIEPEMSIQYIVDIDILTKHYQNLLISSTAMCSKLFIFFSMGSNIGDVKVELNLI
jgi:hypothetical protein